MPWVSVVASALSLAASDHHLTVEQPLTSVLFDKMEKKMHGNVTVSVSEVRECKQTQV